jgi:hypothetical protein
MRGMSTLARRYGHSLSKARAHTRAFIADNPEATAAGIGAAVGATFAGIPAAAVALVGATTGVVGQRLVKACREGRQR